MKPDIFPRLIITNFLPLSPLPGFARSAGGKKKVGEANIFPDKDKFTIMSWENSSLGSLPLLPYNGSGAPSHSEEH
jgi:hypothetical protein